ncbi:IS5/IS1182 family transposase, partial [Nonomuraea sp. KC401]
LKGWRILRKLRCSPSKASHLCKAIAVLQNHRVTQAG